LDTASTIKPFTKKGNGLKFAIEEGQHREECLCHSSFCAKKVYRWR